MIGFAKFVRLVFVLCLAGGKTGAGGWERNLFLFFFFDGEKKRQGFSHILVHVSHALLGAGMSQLKFYGCGFSFLSSYIMLGVNTI